MPGVRYGPDIADDAAAIYKGIKDLNDKEQALKRKAQAAKKSGKAVKSAQLNKKDKAKYDRLAKLATDIFGVSRRDLQRGKYGDLYKMQRYSQQGVTSRGAKSKGAKFARNKRTGKIKRSSELKEYSRRSEGKSTRSQDRSGGTMESYLGLTKPKGYREIEARALKRMARGGVRVGASKKKVKNRAGLDAIGIARVTRTGGFTSGPAAGKGRLPSARPPLVGSRARKPRAAASSTRARGAQAATKKTVRSAGKTKPGTRKKK
jgi:hypothetical protein